GAAKHGVLADLVRHLPGPRHGDRFHSPADRHESVRDSADRTRYSFGTDLQGRGALPRRRPGASDAADRRAFTGAGVAGVVDAMNALPPSIAQALADPLADARARAKIGR